jgi:AcrR family transcriptional regulator
MRVRTEAKREAILEEASKAFVELGFERASMAEISARVGGSKATLYSYFESKEQLFVAVAQSVGEKYVWPAFEALTRCADGDEAAALQRFGEDFVGFTAQPYAVAIQRMVISESGHTSIGQLFFSTGPKRGNDAIAAFLEQAMARGRLRRADAGVATDHLIALLNAEIMPRRLLGLAVNTSKANIRKVVARAVSAFMAAYSA